MTVAASEIIPAVKQFTDQERDLIVELAYKITGSNLTTASKVNSCLVNVQRRIDATKSSNLAGYLARLEISTEELAHFISAVTIHTTSWFREMPHYDGLKRIVENLVAGFDGNRSKIVFRVLSAGCSTGEEAFSTALILEDFRKTYSFFDYHIEGWDVDPVSVAKANQAVFNIAARGDIPAQWQKYLLIGTGRTAGFFTVDKDIRDRCTFHRRSLVAAKQAMDQAYDLIFCRNVLIYFNETSVAEIIRSLAKYMTTQSHLCLGHSESIDAKLFQFEAVGHSTYKLKTRTASLSVVSETTDNVPVPNLKVIRRRPHLIVIGASTGGTEVLVQMLQNLPKPCPPVAVVQHIALSFSRVFAERLAQSAGLILATPDQGMLMQPNHLYMALDDYHIGVKQRVDGYLLEIIRSPTLHGVRPSVDILFQSVARCAKHNPVMGILLTGMGKDGAEGLVQLRNTGATTLVQDERSSTVFGMPREAIKRGAAGFIGDPMQIRQQMNLALKL